MEITFKAYYALKAATFRGGFISFIIFVLFGGVVGVVWYGGNLVLQGELAFKDLFTFIIYTGFIGVECGECEIGATFSKG